MRQASLSIAVERYIMPKNASKALETKLKLTFFFFVAYPYVSRPALHKSA